MPVYSIDTSSLVAGWLERYPPHNFPGFWENFDAMVQRNEIVASREVLTEVGRRDDALFEWCRARPALFVDPTEECQDHVIDIMARYPRFVDTRTGKNSGDPFVIALAKSYNPGLIVITEENGGSRERPAIPYVCGQDGVRTMKLLQLIQEKNWSYR